MLRYPVVLCKERLRDRIFRVIQFVDVPHIERTEDGVQFGPVDDPVVFRGIVLRPSLRRACAGVLAAARTWNFLKPPQAAQLEPDALTDIG